MARGADLAIVGARVATMGAAPGPRCGAGMGDAGLLVGDVVLRGGRIEAVGPRAARGIRARRTIRAGGRLLTPGLIDPHTHAVFAGTREDEFELRNSGVSYAEIAARGGGIRRSVAQVRAATGAAIVRRARPALRRMLEAGTTTLEIKSGYGLTLPDELKLLRAARTLGKEGAPEVVATFLGAHDVPPEFSADRAGYVRLLCGVMIPAVAKAGLAAWCDVFCERGAFSVEESRAILLAGRAAGLGLRIHAEEFATLGGARLAAELGAASADHLMAIDAAGIEAMRRGGTVATLLPGTTLFLGLSTWAPARALIDAGVPVALATDFNPGSSHIESLQLIWTLAATHLHMTAAECLAASTVNAAHALRIGDRVGRIAPGMQGDMVLWDADDIRLVPYRAGGNSVDVVIKSGRVVVDRQARAAR